MDFQTLESQNWDVVDRMKVIFKEEQPKQDSQGGAQGAALDPSHSSHHTHTWTGEISSRDLSEFDGVETLGPKTAFW